MNSRVGTAEVAYVVASGTAVPLVAELERTLQGPVAERLDDDLADQLLDPGAVVCLRHVHVDIDLPAAVPLADDTVRAWARQLAAGIRRTADRDGQVMVFPDENSYWADLLADLIDGRAPAWFQNADAGHWEKSRPEALVDVLDLSGDPGGVLLRLVERRPRALAPLLRTLPSPAAATAARQVLGTGDEGEAPLIAAALAVADRLALWRVPRWSPARLRAAGVRPAVADWRSTQALTASVVALVEDLVHLHVLRAPTKASDLPAELAAEPAAAWLDPYVLATGLFALQSETTRPTEGPPPTTPREPAARPPTETLRMRPGLPEADDTRFRERRGSAVQGSTAGEPLHADEAPAGPDSTTPLRPGDPPDTGTGTDPDAVVAPEHGAGRHRTFDAHAAGSARPERLAADIARILTDEQELLATLDTADAAALFLAATLEARFPQWRGDALVGPTIRRTVASWEIPPTSAGLDERVRPVDPPRAAQAGGDVLAADADIVRRSTSLDEGAGVLLVLRAVVDLRLPATILRADDDPDAVPSALLATACRLATADPTPATAIFAGLVDGVPDPQRLSALTLPWSPERCGALGRELQTVLRAQGLDAEELETGSGVGALVAEAVLRAWRRWLGGLARSSTGYLLTQFLRRPGQVEVQPRRVVVTLASRPLDVVLERVGYLAPLREVALLGGRDLIFRTEE